MRWRPLSVMLLAACGGRLDYLPPAPVTAPANQVEVATPKATVWTRLVAELGRTQFTINTLDRESGLINLSYRGDPERHLDCGQITSRVKNLAGTRSYVFPAARASQRYEQLEGVQLFNVHRQMALEGRLNVVVESLAARRTRVSVHAQYQVTRTLVATPWEGGDPLRAEHRLTFTTGESASFPPGGTTPTTCRGTGALEDDVLRVVR